MQKPWFKLESKKPLQLDGIGCAPIQKDDSLKGWLLDSVLLEEVFETAKARQKHRSRA